ncbi:hypothetical protein PN465_04215 [Nodularia spumigena CS-584]|mgnify:CR=1 FL=1|jgi:hypothetical protein|uniref:Bacteriocin n=2 Tax=Nodularia spumigena TaxID=70799 RepID=A0A166JPD6_NODSP|nr:MULTISPECIES: hypothetical protein [Cyanophyceae]MDB9357446.1 hypothetical protein [Nodularia spumigena CS-587/03]AHJ27157.1 hypothetical protein NSP_8090 [Nodularia spumigena CCY9414]EAW45996.1 hypothetical protein N9414_14072 [Nodularia spumigena CCY9414]KZL49968.1 hypothetical protein A2T98_09930 [Nodularia spumigena CENA596]MDB9303542.1 hypothetical protein [Nodularia spumigena CS-591/12]
MANITLSELHVAGSELFNDSESFLNEFSDVDSISGGQVGYAGGVSDPTTLMKLAEAFVTVYAIGHVTVLAKSFSASNV